MFNRFRPVGWIVAREVRDQMRDWRIMIPIAFLTAVFPFLIGFVSGQVVRFVQSYDQEIIAEHLIPFFLLVVGFFPVTISLVIAAESFVGEKERRSIEPLLSSPLEDWQMYLGKLIAVVFPPLFGSFIGMSVYLLSTYIQFGFIQNWDLIILVIALTVVQAFTMVSAAVVISTQATSVRAANLLASFIVVPMAFLLQWEAIEMFWGDYEQLWWVVLGLIVVSTLFTRMGISHFNREELLGTEFDKLNVAYMLGVFKSRFLGEADSIKSWFKVEIPKTFKEMKIGILLMTLILIAAWGVGIGLADVYQIPPEWIDLDQMQVGLDERFGEYDLLSGSSIVTVWFQNIRAIFLGTMLSVITFGVLGTLVLVFPFAFLGYFMVPLTGAGIPLWKYLVVFVLPHGIFEIPGLILIGAAILKIGAGLVTPTKGNPISYGLLRSLADWTKIMIGVVAPLLLMAAIMEALVTPRLAIMLLTN
ncbi:MAG: stage II sporulation protein M [Chloroflexota bacterium]